MGLAQEQQAAQQMRDQANKKRSEANNADPAKMASLQQEAVNFENNAQQHDAQMRNLQQQLNDADAQIQTLQQQADGFQQTIQNTTNQLNDTQAKIQQLHDKKQQLL